MGRDDPQFNLRLPYELKAKVTQRAKMNGRSLNAELIQIIQDAIAQPSPIIGYRDEVEKLASVHAEEIRQLVMERLVSHYRKKE
ncbi:Arc family DNA-binding protein [Pectobacterium parmentieri]|uniref:Arc family DNA-binding protein n=1 Tax=Pectobacterium parmentieri TaxID=1905730 RepID=UPI0018E005AA|nr:Arc family DNA-binding protein [Pectobacterium parmentieri]MBI0520781.1 Arc family DNA-binding protein [Pectobacterium parmentieri]